MSECSARPDNLADFQSKTSPLDADIESARSTLAAAHASFQANNKWGGMDASGLLANIGQFVSLNKADARWVAGVGEAFRAADASGDVAYASSGQIASSLQAAGIPSSGRADIQVEASVAMGGLQSSGYANDPVSAASGNFIEVEIDLGFGPTLADLQVRRTYNSRDSADGPFGQGWSSWATARLKTTGDGWATWRGPDGQSALIDLSIGTCAGFEGRVEIDGSSAGGSAAEGGRGGMIATFADQSMTWRFDAEGRPTETSRGPGTRLRFEFDGARLVGMVHELGRRVDFGWAGDRITSALADDDRRVDYSYDAAGRLVAVDGPMGARRYEIDEAGRIATVTDADGVVAAANTYDDLGRVLTQRSEFGRDTHFHYDGLVTLVDDDAGGPTNRYEHDVAGRLVSVTDGHNQAITKSYDVAGHLVKVTDRNGATSRYEWDDHDHQVAMVDPDGVRTETTYDDLGRPVTVTRGHVITRFTYSGEDRTPVEIVDPEGGVTRFELVDGQIIAATDPDGVRVELAYDPEGRVTSATDALGGVYAFEWNTAGQLAASTTPAGRRTVFERDAAGRVSAQTSPGGRTTTVERSAAGRPMAVLDPAGNRRVLERGEHGRVVGETDPNGATTSARYDMFGNIEARTTPEGGKWEYSYDSLMRLVGVTDPSGSTWLRDYDAEGNLTATITPEGVRRSSLVDGTGRIIELDDGVTSARFDYDNLGRPVAQIRPDGTTVSGTYDLAGRQTSLTEPTGGTTHFEYTPAGRMAALVGPDGARVTFGYDPAGRLTTVTNPNDATRTLGMDPDGLVTSVTEPTGETTTYDYDLDGRVVAVTAPNGGRTAYEHDPVGRVAAVISPTGGTVTYTYDAAGHVTEVTDPNDGTIGFERDLNGRVIADIDPTGATTRYRLDEMGRILERTDPLGRSTTMAYDSSGRLSRRTDPDGRQWSWTYDPSDRVAGYEVDGYRVDVDRDALARPIRITDTAGVTVERKWNPDGSLTAEIVTTPIGTTVLGWSYDQAGRRIAWTANGDTTNIGYDPAGRAIRVDDPAAGSITIGRDPAGRVTQLAYGGHTETRSHTDGLLVDWATTRTNNPTQRVQLQRDAAGRITSQTLTQADGQARSTAAGYDAAGQLTSFGDRTFTYDQAGRISTEAGPSGATSYTYDNASQLTRIARGDDSQSVDIAWDASGRRVSETASDGGSRSYSYGPAGRLSGISTSSSDGANSSRSLTHDPVGRLVGIDHAALGWDPTGAVDTLRSVGDTRLIGADTPLGTAQADSGQASWLDRDHRGTANPTDPFGTGAAVNPLSDLPGIGIGHSGGLNIDDQLWLGERLYDPSSRAFTTPDPLAGIPGFAAASNPYHYANNDPLNQIDPTGRRPMTDAQLDDVRSSWDDNAWDRYGGYVVAGALVVGGIAVMATGVGGPIGGAMIAGALMSGGMSAGTQQFTTGGVDYGKVGVDMAIGAAAGGAGAAVGSAASASSLVARSGPIARTVIAGTADSVAGGMTERALNGQNPLDPNGLRTDLLTGGLTSTAGGVMGSRSSSIDDVNVNTPRSAVDSPGQTANPVDLYHATPSPEATQGLVNGVDPNRLNPESRFGEALYLAEQPDTALAELAHHDVTPTHGVRYSADPSAARVLDLTEPSTASQWGYNGGDISSSTQAIGPKASGAGYNAIRFPSERGAGANWAVLGDWDSVLSPQMITPVP